MGSSVCGGSAIAATAPVIGADDEEIAQSISVIFLFNVAAALLFPTLGGLLGLGNEGFGLFAGTAVNDTSSVTAAAAAWDGMHPGANTLDTATIVKLTRTLAIIPITLALALRRTARARRAGGAGEGSFSLRRVFPFFLLFFMLASLITTGASLAGVDAAAFAPFKELSKFFIIMAMAAIGLNTDLIKLVRTGGRPILMGLCCWAAITAVSLGMQYALGLAKKTRTRMAGARIQRCSSHSFFRARRTKQMSRTTQSPTMASHTPMAPRPKWRPSR